jgi:peptidoglycan hydrolase CwlO-like protein
MPTTIAEYYTDELINWNDTIIFYNEEMNYLTQQFAEVIQRNSIEGIAKKVEAHQDQLNGLSDKFYKLQIQIDEQKNALKTDSTYIDNGLIDEQIERRQLELRNKMRAAEKEYIDVKFTCDNFLSGTLMQ